ncbi:MAG: C-GCAxxG-C-C family protein [Promethearchaeota archaeon]
MSRIEEAISYFKGNFNCTQAVLNTYSNIYGQDSDKALKIATGFGGGMGGLGRTCGAVTGAYMVIGLKYGMGVNEDVEAKGKTAQIIRDFTQKFEEINKSVLCKELLDCDINILENKGYFNQNELLENRCLKFVKDAIEILEVLL